MRVYHQTPADEYIRVRMDINVVRQTHDGIREVMRSDMPVEVTV